MNIRGNEERGNRKDVNKLRLKQREEKRNRKKRKGDYTIICAIVLTRREGRKGEISIASG